MKKSIHTYFVEITDTFAGEANYCWVKRYLVESVSVQGAMAKISKESGYNWRVDYKGEISRYNAKGACICAFIQWCDSPLQVKQQYNNIVTL
jgi:hypothetical protein